MRYQILAGIAFILISIFSDSAYAQQARYVVEMNGAGVLTPFLNKFLDIQRHANDIEMNDVEWQRLAKAAPQQMRDLLATEGYFTPIIVNDLRRDGVNWIAQFNVRLGEPIRIDAIDMQWDGEIARGIHADTQPIAQVRLQWSLKSGDVFRQAAWTEAKDALLNSLLLRGYPAAKIIESEARIDLSKLRATLVVKIDSGPRFTLGALQIDGLQRYSREMIERLNPIKIGDEFAQEKLTELQARLQDSGYFRTAFATIDANPEHSIQVPVRVDVTEYERHRLSLGGGFSTNSGAHVQAKWLDRRFLGHDWRLESELRLDRQTRIAGGDLYFPARSNDSLLSGWLPSLGAHIARTDMSNEVSNKVRMDARMTGPIKTDEEVWGISYLTEQQRIDQTDANNRQALVAIYSYTQRRMDNLIAPNQGYAATLELSAGPRGLLNEANIARLFVKANWLSSTRKRWQMIARAQLGQVFSVASEAVPSDLLFRAGGDQSVRGYGFNSLGVLQNNAIVGGRVTAVASAELEYHLTPTWGVAVFRDLGNAADKWRDFHAVHGAGLGARWRSPIGTVNLDFAYGYATRQTRLHFTVGYGF